METTQWNKNKKLCREASKRDNAIWDFDVTIWLGSIFFLCSAQVCVLFWLVISISVKTPEKLLMDENKIYTADLAGIIRPRPKSPGKRLEKKSISWQSKNFYFSLTLTLMDAFISIDIIRKFPLLSMLFYAFSGYVAEARYKNLTLLLLLPKKVFTMSERTNENTFRILERAK